MEYTWIEDIGMARRISSSRVVCARSLITINGAASHKRNHHDYCYKPTPLLRFSFEPQSLPQARSDLPCQSPRTQTSSLEPS
ncbi:hypothetical protein I7I53_08041 [Histoplasma capsulatum var. duboisii H88]|uniref:Uncharacterized protein n=1 Tax=Ajellomyces capsulatus (strain H88) TaxID=544711 RepID=A0A8A1LEU9_AJEC8|nr:hypothetical protein I7I53_08041 [Histoplasma capsulatum var. duboisii H88]